VTIVVIASDGGVLDGAVHAFNLPVRPGMIDLGEARNAQRLARLACKATHYLGEPGRQAWLVTLLAQVRPANSTAGSDKLARITVVHCKNPGT